MPDLQLQKPNVLQGTEYSCAVEESDITSL